MKIKIWIRNKDGKPTMRLDYEYENLDTPVIQRYGRKLLDALEGGGEKSK